MSGHSTKSVRWALIIGLAVVLSGLLLFIGTGQYNALIRPGISAYRPPEPARDIVVVGNYAYIPTGERRLWVLDVTSPTAPIARGYYDAPAPLSAFVVAGNYAYIAAGERGLRIVDLTNPAAPVEVGSYDPLELAIGVAVAGNYAYIVAGQDGLRVVDIANPSAPTEVGAYDEPLGWLDAHDVVIANGYAYLPGGPVLDISKPTRPLEVGYLSDEAAWDSYFFLGTTWAVQGDVAVFIHRGGCGDPCDSNGLFVVDLANPTAPATLGIYISSLTPPFRDIAVAGKYAYIAASEEGVRVVDITNPAVPMDRGRYDRVGVAEHLTIADDYLYIVTQKGDLAILRHTDSSLLQTLPTATTTLAAPATPILSTYTYYGQSLTPRPARVDQVPVPPAWLIVAGEGIPATYGSIATAQQLLPAAPPESLADLATAQLVSTGQALTIIIGSPKISAAQLFVRAWTKTMVVTPQVPSYQVKRRGNQLDFTLTGENILLSNATQEMAIPVDQLLIMAVTLTDGTTVEYLWRLNPRS